ncbi:purine nucleoside phosphorylase I, inosine and guanosine-specific [Owenweeksia hongkongensis DSM 17368]|uniref:Purine nucleoside phosphorylase n=1 Tax=Owenweeksia hongkongensis (strain DSM 17368 / CIP 108786 / JCM 12287 / NRRL B-23963 / UST20020801) TaxID=926562 RepID=G8R456_OWEHD|nr:purine-nucleoside phosphorylase [Owenweeksia hongkongensis]AEV33123.1 purine nucleoside phosphorylase I, inosine and guanosine-specific [Owenweeksia hongkongensis DSM 17368]
MIHRIEEASEFLRRKGFDKADVGIVLGTGLGKFIEKMEVLERVHYSSIPHFPVATMEFHAGQLVLGLVAGKRVIAMQGRFHFYEGYSTKEITFPLRVMKLLGIKNLLLSNAAGGINLNYKKGDLVLIDDHINLQTENPLTGPNPEILGPRFPDMSQPYSRDLGAKFKEIAKQKVVNIKEGVYVAVPGPNLETRAEYRFLGIIGADLVGMSTVPEVIVANHMGVPCMAVSVITDECNPDDLKSVAIDEIIAVANKADNVLSSLFAELIEKL